MEEMDPTFKGITTYSTTKNKMFLNLKKWTRLLRGLRPAVLVLRLWQSPV